MGPSKYEEDEIDSRFKFITDVQRLCWIDLRLLTGTKENLRSGFLDPFLPTDQDRIEG